MTLPEIEWEPYVHPSKRDDLFLIGGAGVHRIGHYGRERYAELDDGSILQEKPNGQWTYLYHAYLRRGIKP